MNLIDWMVVAVYCAASLVLGVILSKKAALGMESYFAGNRNMTWWLAGTSMAATAFSSDTPLLVTGITRTKGIWGNWEIWSLAISTMLAVFFFSRLWKRAGVLTEVELVELRYSGRPASFLRGFKALYWGFFYNAFIIGAWPMTGLVKVMQETTGWDKPFSIFFCLSLTVVYSSLSGYLGVILTDLFQFAWAMTGAVILAIYSVHAVGGPSALVEKLSQTSHLSFLPPSEKYSWLAGLFLIQWWAWKNADGGGIAVQRMVSCKNEKEAMASMLWFNIAHYVLRSWPWIVTGLASLILIPDAALWVGEAGKGYVDHERAYPRLITMLLPAGLRGVLVASFFAAFMSTVDSQLNWGASYLVNDFYKRFVKKDAVQSHYIFISRIATFVLAGAAAWIAFYVSSISQIFTLVLNLTAGLGPVYLLRWFWWRVNAWSEIAAMCASLFLIIIRAKVFSFLGIPPDPLLYLLYMVFGTACFWLPLTFLTSPVPEEHLRNFFKKVSPPGFWKTPSPQPSPTGRGKGEGNLWGEALKNWAIATSALFATLAGPLEMFLGRWLKGSFLVGFAVIGWTYLTRTKFVGERQIPGQADRPGDAPG